MCEESSRDPKTPFLPHLHNNEHAAVVAGVKELVVVINIQPVWNQPRDGIITYSRSDNSKKGLENPEKTGEQAKNLGEEPFQPPPKNFKYRRKAIFWEIKNF